MDSFSVRQATPADARTAADFIHRFIEALCFRDNGASPNGCKPGRPTRPRTTSGPGSARACSFPTVRSGTGEGFAVATPQGRGRALVRGARVAPRGRR